MSTLSHDDLSVEQDRICAIERRSPGNPACILRQLLRIEGPLNEDAFRRAVDAVIDRHPALRTVFSFKDGRSTVLSGSAPISVEVIELGPIPPSAWVEEAQRRALDEAKHPFDLEAGPLTRFKLLRFSPESHVLLIAAHAAVLDEESADRLFDEIIEAYEPVLRDGLSRSSEFPRAEAESGRWHRHWIEKMGKGAHLAYWKEQVAGELPILELPTDRPRPPVWSFRGAAASRQLSPSMGEKIDAMSRAADSSPFSVFLAAFVAGLHRYTDQDDILIGTPVSGRSHPESGDLVGRFAHPLVLRCRLSDDPSLIGLIKHVSAVVEAAKANQALSFGALVKEFHRGSDPARHPLFQAAFEYQASKPPARAGGVVFTRMEAPRDAAEVDIALVVSRRPSGYCVTLAYGADLFKPDTIERMLDHFMMLLAGAAERPEQPVGLLPILTAAERHRMLVEWNDTRTDYPRESCIHELFEQQAERSPDAVAVVFEGESLTYRELNRRANILARRLIKEGVGIDMPVAVSVRRSLEMAVGLLAILKAGGAYMPLDPKYPKERLEIMIEESGAKVLLASSGMAERIPFKGKVIGFEGPEPGGDESNPRSGAKATSIAYVLFTSGSTGRPKAVAVPHRGVVRLVVRTNYVDIVPSDRILQANTLTFDASTFELWAPLLNGACMVVVPQERLLSPPEFSEWLRRQGVTVMFLTTALFHQFASIIPEIFRGLRYFMFGGEACDIKWVREVLEKWSPETLLNAYGPTENTEISTVHVIREVPPDAATIPIGKPVANSTAYVLDRRLQPVPVGVAGELFVGGDGLARGYLSRPELSAERFIRSPLPEAPGATLYRTGDRTRFLPDGSIEFLGRIDDQVKVRGYRVELGEIEAVLGGYEAVREAVIMVRQDNGDEKRLVAYVTPVDNTELTAPLLRAYLQSKLPSFMVPTAFVILDRMPLTSNGKIDRRALPRPLPEKLDAPAKAQGPGVQMAANAKEIEGILSQHPGIREAFVVVRGSPSGKPRLVAFFHKKTSRAPSEEDLRSYLAERLPAAASVSAFFPLVTEPERVLGLERESPGNPACIYVMAARIDGPLDVRGFRRAVNEVIRRHPGLRTAFPIVKGRPTPRVNPTVVVEPAIMDFALLPDYLWDAEILRQASEEAQRPFDPTSGQLLRLSLLRFGRDVHTLLITAHKAIFDDASADILLRDIAAMYPAIASGSPSTPPENPQREGQLTHLRRAWLQDTRVEDHLSYWKDRLAGRPSELGLFTDHARPVVRTFEVGSIATDLAPDLTARLRRLSEDEGVSLEAALLAAWTAFLHRYTEQEDVVVGVPVSGRRHPESRRVIDRLGYSLPLRLSLSGDPSFRALVRRVAGEIASAEPHFDVPLAMLLEHLRVPADSSGHPLFQVGFELRGEPQAEILAPGLTVVPLEVERAGSELDIELLVTLKPEASTATLVFSADLWRPDTVERMLEHFRILLAGAMSDPDQLTSALPLMGDVERERLLVEWNDTRSEYPRDATVHEVFERQVDMAPDAVAAVFGTESITYFELNQRANRLARRLRAEGVRSGARVGVFAERSLETLVALIGVLKAGGVYVPLDPSYPRERLQFMIDDSGAEVLLAPSTADEGTFRRKLVPIGRHADVGVDSENLRSDVVATDVAYVMFTSGSTGRPKGVGVTHRGIVRLVTNQSYIEFSPSDRVLHASNLSFDASTFEIWGALLNGARLVVVSQDTLLSPTAFSAVVARNRISIMLIPTALFHHMASLIPDVFRDLKCLVVGGDALDPKWARTLLEKAAPRRFVNAYGPTENAVISTAHIIRDVPADAPAVPIGGPIANSQAYILDQRMRPVPIGVPGELCVGGDGLAREYLNRPETTATRFVMTSLGSGPPIRLYRTGDRARWLPEGAVEFLGRLDNQVKIRGFRVEIGEIEAVLGGLPGVRESVVLVKEEALGDKRLIAFASPLEGVCLSSAELLGALRERLPGFMVPSSVVVLEHLPLTPNGKVNRSALASMEVERVDEGRAFVAPRNAMEVALSAIWCDVLGVPKVGVHDSFFDLGGRSLMALRLLMRVRDEFQVDLPVRVLFDTPTIVGLVSAIEAARAKGQSVKTQLIKPVSRERPLPLSFAQQQLWLLVQVEPESPFYNEPFTIHIPGALNAGALERTLQEIIRRHDILRTTFSGMRGRGGLSTAPRYTTAAWPLAGGGQRVMPRPTIGPPSGPLSIAPVSSVPPASVMPMQLVSPTSTFTLAKVDLRDLPEVDREAEALRIATEEARRPFHLGIGPLVRATLVRLQDDEHRLFITMHHIITDGISLHVVLLKELSAIYEAFAAGRPSPLQDLPIQFGDFAVWQRRTHTVEALDQHIEYWDRKLAGVTALDLPTDRPRPAAKTFKGRKHYCTIPDDVMVALRELGNRQGATTFMVLLAAFKVLLHRYSGQDDIIVGTVTSGRPRLELENLIGFFVNPLALRTDLRDAPTFLSLLDRVRETTLEAYAHQDVPFEMLVEELRVVRSQSQNPLFQVAFVLEPPMLKLDSGWTISQHDVDTGTSKFDLTLDIDDRLDGTTARFEYDGDLFTAATIERMAGHFQNLVAAIVASPNLRISALPLTAGQEEAAMLLRSRSATSTPKELCLHQLFEAEAARRPSATAVVLEPARLTYADLDRRSNQLANHLRRLGVGPEVLVAIYMERSLDVVVAILGVLKAGGAYVPLDPDFPTGRVRYVLDDSRAPVILTQARLREKLPATSARIVAIDGDRAALADEPSTPPQTGVGPDNLAYVMYIAGASSKPKGIMIPHHNVARLFRATADDLRFDERDVWTMFHSHAFDFSVWELWGALLHGGKLVIVPKSTTRSPEELYQLLRTQRVTVLNLVPAAFFSLMAVEDDLDGSSDLSLRSVFLGGDAFDFRAIKPWLDRHGDQRPRIWNLYGLVGATVFVTYRPVTSSDMGSVTRSRIGRPVSDMEFYILDSEQRPAPIGVPGEIHLGGPGVARGYLNRPDLEADRFVRHPWSSDPAARLYRTHDRARYLPDGDIEYMGRLDEQMRIRGFRVEPTEIEAVLLEHPDVREAAVTVREDTPGDQRLVAYYVKRGERLPTTNEFRSFLRERLPDYLVPTIYIALPTIPTISGGKTNRQSLPPPDKNRPSLMPVFRLPNSAVEVLLLGIWTRVLQVNQIGRNDDFFSLGGHSLLAAQMIARVRETFRIDMRHSSFLLREFLETPTIAGLAEAVEVVRDATPSVRAKRGTVIDFDAEARLDFSIRFDAPPVESPPDDPNAVLLTGATGFMGAFLLHELLQQTRADIYCVVRAPDVEAARKRIEKNMRDNLVWDESKSSRIIPVPGDLAQLLLGLTPERFAELAEKIDVIYHNGSFVNFIYPYTALKAANVGGTQEVIRLATQVRLKPVHYVSTLAVLASYGFLGVRGVSEDTVLANANRLYMGYPESKYVAEKMLMHASQQGLPVSIYRPHDVTGHSKTGAWRTEGFLCAFLHALFDIGAVPDVNLPLDYAPVDYVTKAIIHISMNEPAVGSVFHLNNPRYSRLSTMIEKLKARGYSLQRLPYHTWVQKLVDFAARNPNAVIAPFVPLFVERWSEAQISVFEMYTEDKIPVFDTRNARAALAGTGIVCPPVDDAMLGKYLDYFVSTGFLPPPPNTA